MESQNQEGIRIETVAPDFYSPLGRSWYQPPSPEWTPCQVLKMILYFPTAHPIIDFFYLGLIDLTKSASNTQETFPPTFSAGSNFEFHVGGIIPGSPIYVDKDPLVILPPFFVGQWYAKDKDSALKYVLHVIAEILGGELSFLPQENANEWIIRFGYNQTISGPVSIQAAHRLESELSSQTKH